MQGEVWVSLFPSRVPEVAPAHSKNSPMANMVYHEMKKMDSLIKELAKQKTKIDSAFKIKPDQI